MSKEIESLLTGLSQELRSRNFLKHHDVGQNWGGMHCVIYPRAICQSLIMFQKGPEQKREKIIHRKWEQSMQRCHALHRVNTVHVDESFPLFGSVILNIQKYLKTRRHHKPGIQYRFLTWTATTVPQVFSTANQGMQESGAIVRN